MNKNLMVAGIFSIVCISACADKEPDHDSSLMVSDSSKLSTPVSNAPQNIVTTDTATLPGAQPVSITQMPAQTVQQVTATTAPGMNPPHGQPGHRCDIAVGAPLNSPASKPATQTTQTVTSTAAKTVTAPGMNPPHGEPNHRCDIAVGAPLNSPATKPATQTVAPTNVPPVSAPVELPAKKDTGG